MQDLLAGGEINVPHVENQRPASDEGGGRQAGRVVTRYRLLPAQRTGRLGVVGRILDRELNYKANLLTE
jgi:hypothetical protein